MKKCVNEFAVVKTDNDYVLASQYDDGSIEISYERHRVDNSHVEVIQHRNRDRLGNYYTTKKIIESTVVCPCEEPFGEYKWRKEHAERLYKAVEDAMSRVSTSALLNLISTAKRYASDDSMECNPEVKAKLENLIYHMEVEEECRRKEVTDETAEDNA